MKSNLSKRIKKAKQLRIIPAASGEKGCYNTYGSNDDHYKIFLKSGEKYMATPDGYRPTKVFYTHCEKSTVTIDNPYNETCQHCKGNIRSTVCYHALGAIWFSLTQAGFQVSFFQFYHDAVNGLNFGGTLAKIENQGNTGSVWCVYKKEGEKKQPHQFVTELPERKNRSRLEENVNLMRGTEEESEGID